MLLSYLGIKEDKLNIQYNKKENLKLIAEITEIEERIQADTNHTSLMKQCYKDHNYLTYCGGREVFEKRMGDCEIDIDGISKYIEDTRSNEQSSKQEASHNSVVDNQPAISIRLAPLRQTVSYPTRNIQPQDSSSPAKWKSVANKAVKSQTGSTFEELKQKRLTINAVTLLSKINELKKITNENSDSEEEPVTVVKYTPSQARAHSEQVVTKDGAFLKKEDRSYAARLGIQFHLIFSRAQEQVYDCRSLSREDSIKPTFAPMRSNSRQLRQQLKTSKTVPILPPINPKSTKGKSLVKKGDKQRQQKEKLTPEEMDTQREAILASRKIYNQSSIKTEEAASIERFVNNKIFSEVGILDKEYLSLGASVFLK